MPPKSSKDCKKAAKRKQQEDSPLSEMASDQDDMFHEELNCDETPIGPKQGKQRAQTSLGTAEPVEEAGLDSNYGNNMQTMLEQFGVDVTKALQVKKKRMEQFTRSSVKNSSQRFEQVWKAQQGERQTLSDEFGKQIGIVLRQWEDDVQKIKDFDDKLTSTCRMLQKMSQQARVVQGQRLKTILQLHEQFSKKLQELETLHQEQHTGMQGELRREMAMLQKRLLMDAQHQEMTNVRKSLQSLLY
uniref:Synaptonemal complex protein 3 n=1 Tax=Eptatretus burgeri TaxID=7764 RepID=A0A8C4Q6R2_EPTBU